jgi:hypothetical protein
MLCQWMNLAFCLCYVLDGITDRHSCNVASVSLLATMGYDVFKSAFIVPPN